MQMYNTIDKIRQGHNPWKSVPFRYNGPMPKTPPKWMSEEYVLVTRNICHLLDEQIACTDFDGHWDYTPFIEFDHAGNRVWTNIMSGDWAAKQAVRVFIYFVSPSQQISRMRFLGIRRTMELCSFVLLPEAIKQLHRLQLVIKNSIRYILAQETSTIRRDVLTAVESYHVPFFPFLKVRFSEHFDFRNSFFRFFILKRAKRREKRSRSSSFAANYIMRVLLISTNLLNLQ